MSYKIVASGFSDIGLVRQNNEDVWAQLPKENFYVIADGMGGHRAGEIASRVAVEAICKLFVDKFKNSDHSLHTCKEIVDRCIRETNQFVYQLGSAHDELSGMGTTLCCLLFVEEGLIYAHVGDSRIYRLRENKLQQLTSDHSLLSEMIHSGQIEEDEAEGFAYKNIITRAIGTEPYVEPAVEEDFLLRGDILLMCTDGLTDMLSEQEMEHILKKKSTVHNIAKTLVEEAKKKGGIDNITVVVAKVQ